VSWFRVDGETIIVSIHAQPGTKRTEIQVVHGDALKIRIAAVPVEGKANAELVRFLAAIFRVRQRDIELLTGESARAKQFRIHGSKIAPASLEPAGQSES
jgi:uncharacterized protein (TIGR00251 family)